MKYLLNFKLPIFLILVFIGVYFFGYCMTYEVKSFFYSISLTLKELLIFILPFIVFSFLFSSMGSLRENTLWFILLLLPCVCLSNFCSTLIAYGAGKLIFSSGIVFSKITLSEAQGLKPLWTWSLTKWIRNDIALGLGMILGIMVGFFRPDMHRHVSKVLLKMSHFFLRQVFVPLMPLFIFGFVLKLEHDKVLEIIYWDYPRVLLGILAVTYSYLFLIYGLINRFHLSAWGRSISNMMSPMITGFSTMSSAAALPLTLMASEKNVKQRELVDAVIPSTVNIHLVGDSIAIPIFCLVILLSFGHSLPSWETYLVFSFFFVIAKFAVAAVPGGGILVMLPIIEHVLGFSSPMLSLITAIYVIFDPVITAANILGNGGFIMVFSKLYQKIVSRFGFKTDAKI